MVKIIYLNLEALATSQSQKVFSFHQLFGMMVTRDG